MKKLVLICTSGLVALLLLLVALPLYSPLLGLAAHRDELFPPGTNTPIGNELFLNRYEYGPPGGQAIVLVHGVPGSAAMMHPLALALAEHGYQVFSYDRLGWAHSARRPDDVLADPSNNGSELVDFVTALDLESPILVGYSYGGGVVQEANRISPQLSACNVLISSLGNGRRNSGSRGLMSRVLFSEPMLRWALAVTPVATSVSAGNMNALYFPETPKSTAEVYQFLAALELSVVAWRREINERFQSFEAFSPQTIVKPTLIIHGNEDRTVRSSVAERLHTEIPDSTLKIYQHTGHAIVITRATELAVEINKFTSSCV